MLWPELIGKSSIVNKHALRTRSKQSGSDVTGMYIDIDNRVVTSIIYDIDLVVGGAVKWTAIKLWLCIYCGWSC